MTTFDMSESIQARSDQQNYDDYVGGISKVVTISEVRGGSAEQPVELHLVEAPGKAYKPSKSMRRVLVFAWGPDASVYIGRRLRLYGDPDVRFGGKVVGGIKIGAMSHVERSFTLALTETRGTKKPHTVEPLPDTPTTGPSLNDLFEAGGLDKTKRNERLTVAKVIAKRPEITGVGGLDAAEMTAIVDQLATWQASGKLGEEIDNILDLAAIEAEGKA